ncbi:hypothetical protein ACFSYG_19550 [Leeuwenhoekiella polynyae]|uniref:Uncharacterized protein n=1 Tax=Leeuwenhoekiella polynyae TaxID=1550906 RepID=A0A4Q0PFG5_9FLAO|nr:hypothetical protein [Leeuwenhoekiella polynyae]RXG25256.1 hypothetical protein DSM02_1226 [Leeuwenhoekiella polynyae]
MERTTFSLIKEVNDLCTTACKHLNIIDITKLVVLSVSCGAFKMYIFTRNKELNFSKENIESLTKSVTELKDVLIKIGTSGITTLYWT